MAMNTVKILRQLWAKRLFVAGAAVLAFAVGYGAAFGLSAPSLSGSKPVAVANERLLVDTPSSQVVAVAPTGLDMLTGRATLLASLMTDGVIKAAIARRAGLQPDQLYGFAQAVYDPTQPASPPTPAQPYVLTTNVLSPSSPGPDSNQLPVITLQAQAPDASAAATLANAAVAGLRDYLGSVAATQGIPLAQRIRVTGLGAPVTVEVVRGTAIVGIAVAAVVFLLACATIVLVPAMVREWRAASEELGPPLRPSERRLSLRRVALPADDGHQESELHPSPASTYVER